VITIVIKGGLGNQMFQYAFAKSLSLRRNQELTLDCRYVNDRTWRPRFTFREYQLNKFGGEKFIFPSQQYFRGEIYIRIGWWRILKQLNNTLKKRVTRIRFECDPYTYDENLVNDHSGNSYHGYFQNPRYFDQFRNEILGEFQHPRKCETIKRSDPEIDKRLHPREKRRLLEK